MHQKTHFQIRKILYGLLVLGMLVFLVGVGNLGSVHAQGSSDLTPIIGKIMPYPFKKLTPANGKTFSASSPIALTWQTNQVPSAHSYFYCYDKTNDNLCEGTMYWNDNTSFTINKGAPWLLDTGSTYYWQVWTCTTADPKPSGCLEANGGTWWSFKTGPATFTSDGTKDGWILESSHGSGVGSSLNAASITFQLGDDLHNRQYRAILSFDTSAIPDNAIIQSAALKIAQTGSAVGTNPFTILGPLNVDIRNGYFGSSSSLQASDFSALADATKVATFGTTPVGAWYSATLNPLGRAYINKSGLTQIRLYFSTATNANNVADYMKFVSGDGTSKPQLVITYTTP